MDRKKIEEQYKLFCDLVTHHKVKSALELLKNLSSDTTYTSYRLEAEELESNYRNLIKYTVEGVEDPERHKIYQNIMRSTLDLGDRVREQLLTESGAMIYGKKKQLEREIKMTEDEAEQKIDHLTLHSEIQNILGNSTLEADEQESYKNQLRRLFNIIWLTDKYKAANIELVLDLMDSEQVPWYDKSLIVSALNLSLIRTFDVKKFELLFNIYEKGEDQVWQRALVSLLIGLYLYDDRLGLYPEIIEKLHQLREKQKPGKDIEKIALQLFRSKETDKVTKKLRDEILPDVAQKIRPKIEEKLKLDDILSDEFKEDKNPDWETFFEDSPDLMDKMEELTNMQMEGSDVFMSAFSMLKHFDFFREMTNWLIPFYEENDAVQQVMEKEDSEKFDKAAFVESLRKSSYMCDSDKYSFVFNLQQIPEAQKSMMLSMFNAEMESMKELENEDEILNKPARNYSIYTQYIQDLYRFFKLYPQKNEFTDIFKKDLKIHQSKAFEILVEDEQIIRNIAEFFFEKDYFKHALEIYERLNKEGDTSMEIFEKMGYCYQRLGDYQKALNNYSKAELFEANRAWNLKKIALCHRNLNNHEKALNYYKEAEKLEHNNLYIQAAIGHCYLNMKEYEEALQHYFKVEYMSPDNTKILRPIAWVAFLTGRFDQARRYYEKLMAQETNKYDFMNLGHLEWCEGNREDAIKNYLRSIRQEDNTFKAFMNGFNDDKEHLINHGVDPDEIPLVLDFLKYQLQEKE